MVAGNMKIITLTNVATSNSKLQNDNNNILKINSPTSKTNANIAQQVAYNDACGPPKMKYYNGNNFNNNNNSSVKSLQTPKQCGSNKNYKKSHSHILNNIPTTSDSSRQKYYQQHYRHNQQQHNFLASSKDARKNITLKNHNVLDTSNPKDTPVPPYKQNQMLPKLGSSLMKVEDFVNNNTATLDNNNICTPTNNDENCADIIVDNSIAISSFRAESENKQPASSTSPETIAPILLTSDTTSVGQHNCVAENTSINLDCNSCWANLVTPQCTESENRLSWPWVHANRRKSTSVSSTSSYSSGVSSSISAPSGNSSELLQNTNAKNVNITHNTHSTKKKTFRRGNTRNNVDKRCSSPDIKGQHQRRTSNRSTAIDDSQFIKFSTAVTAEEVSIIIENQNTINSAEDPTAKKTAMTSALATNTISATATTPTTVNSTVETNTTDNENTSVKCTGNAVTLTVTTASSTSTNKINSIGEEGITTSSTGTSKAAFTANLTTSSSSSTTSTPRPSSSNSYSLDFLHSVGVQMTGGVNLSPLCKSSTSNMRTNTTFNGQNPVVVSPMHSTYSYQNVLPQRAHTMHGRYTNSSGVVGINTTTSTTSVHTRDQRGHRFQQHHHYPQQLTIASFMQKELLNENFLGRGNSRGRNNGNNIINGNGENGSNDGNNKNGNYRNNQRHNYYTTHGQQSQQQHVSGVQHGYTMGQSSYGNDLENDGISRVTRNGNSSHSQDFNHRMYQNQQNSEKANSNSYQSHPINNHSTHEEEESVGRSGVTDNISGSCESNATMNTNFSNLRASKQVQHKILGNKKGNCVSNATSACSSTSSSASSNSSQASTTSYRHQKVKTFTQMNLAIETLPRKMNTSSHRINHRMQQFNYHSQQYTTVVGGAQSSTAQQPHQNIHNLTYVNTEGLIQFPNVGMSTTASSRSCSPSLPLIPPVTPGPQPQEMPSSMMLSSHTPTQFQHQHQQQQQQQNLVHGKCISAPIAVNLPSAQTTSSQSSSPITADSGKSCDSVQPTISVHVPQNQNHDYEDSDSSSTNSVALSQRRNELQQVKPVSHSSSSSTSSNSSTAARNFTGPQQGITMLDMSHLYSPDPTDFVHHPTFVPSAHHYMPQAQQQQSPFHRNEVMSVFNVQLDNSCTDDDLCSIKQQVPQHQKVHNLHRHFYFASGEHLNATPLSSHTGNGGYWSPLQHSNFLYSQPANLIASGPIPTTRVSDNDDHNQHNHHYLHLHNQQQQQQLNIANQTEVLPTSSHLKGSSTSQMAGGTIIPQQSHQHHCLPQSTALQGAVITTANSVASSRQRSGGRNQQQVPQHHHVLATPPPPPPPPLSSISHVYPQHNLLFNGPQTHIRSSINLSHDFFTHTPPDRFLAKSHLIEAKEAPNTLLNHSKWDNLSQDVWNKFINYQQTEETFKQKMHLWRRLYITIKINYPRFGLYMVGSTISGFGADTSDVDMCLVSRSTSNVEPRMEALFNLTVLRDHLGKTGEFENFNLIEAKVPILRFNDRNQLEVDLNFNNCVGIKNTHLLYCYSQLDWRLRPMVLVTKLWAQYHNINNAKNMTISSYSLVLMVIHFLQYAVSPAVLPCLHDLFPEKFPLLRSNDFGYIDLNETLGPYESKNTQTIGELFLHFLEYYSCFDYTQFAISIRTGGLLPINICRLAKSSKNDIHQWKELCIEEPFDLTNTARSVYDFDTFERVKAVFVTSWRILQQTLDLNSIFAPIIITTNRVASTLSRSDIQYVDPNGSSSSEISTIENTTHITTNGSTTILEEDSSMSVSPNVTLVPLVEDRSKKHNIDGITHRNINGDSTTADGSLKELVS